MLDVRNNDETGAIICIGTHQLLNQNVFHFQ